MGSFVLVNDNVVVILLPAHRSIHFGLQVLNGLRGMNGGYLVGLAVYGDGQWLLFGLIALDDPVKEGLPAPRGSVNLYNRKPTHPQILCVGSGCSGTHGRESLAPPQ